MTEQDTKESELGENGEEKKTRSQKYTKVESRNKILKGFQDVMKCPKEERREELRTTIFEFFDEDLLNSRLEVEDSFEKVNIYEMILIMLQNIPDRKKPIGKTLTQWFLDDFLSWMEAKNIEEELKNEQLTDEIQLRGIRKCINYVQFSESLERIFCVSKEMISNERDEMIRSMMENHQFKEASDIIMKHGLVENYTFDELVLPLILFDKVPYVDELLKMSPRFQKDYLRFLDYFVGETEEYINAFFEPYKEKGLLKINVNRYYGKSLTTFISKFFNEKVKQFHFDLEERRDAPRYEQLMKGRALRYFCKQRFETGTMADEVYFEHVKNTLQQSSDRTIAFYLNVLWDSGVHERRIEALFWIKYLPNAMNSIRIHQQFQRFFENPDETMMNEVDRLVDLRQKQSEPEILEQLFVFEDDQKYPISIVKSESEVDELCKELDSLEKGEYVGYDGEFKPSHLVDSHNSKMAIMQLFFNQKVIIIDCVELEKLPNRDEFWSKIYETLFESKKFKVIGFDLKNDMEALYSVQTICDNYKTENIDNCICVKRFVDILNNLDLSILNLEEKSTKLTTLTRPLRKNQIVYAAKDSAAVMELFLKLMEKSKENSVDIDKILMDSHMVMTTKKVAEKKVNKALNTMKWSEVYEILHTHRDASKPVQNISEIRIIADMMVLGAAKNLRLLGAGVLLPNTMSELMKFVEETEQMKSDDQRYILTIPSRSYEILRADYPNLKYILLQNVHSKTPLDLICDFFDNFNFEISPNDGFSY
uniref:3'-5' exonuclease domain-containing protein n=1 Tax=Caenorhabditis tropicalis TaxID=1561998 RepID=A0A1I7UQM9_9PELO